MKCKICGNKIKSYDGHSGRTKCGSCTTKLRRYRTKLAGIALLGGKCNRCGFNKHHVALEFHHPDDNKEFAIGNVANKAWSVVKKEILKCELLCANCHRINHSNRDSKEFLKAAQEYKGIELV
jgi:hypothetical protein